jgi:replicative DNA helicase
MLIESSKKDLLSIEQLIDFRNTLDNSINEITSKNKITYTIHEMFDIYIKELHEREKGLNFYDSGCNYLNDLLQDGFAPQKITIMFGQSGIGKSSYALYMVNKQINKMIPNIYISPEMPLISTMDRLIAQRCDVNISSLYLAKNSQEFNDTQSLDDSIIDMVIAEKEKLSKCNHFRFVEEPSLYWNRIESIIKETKKEMKVDYLIVTIDLLTMIKDFNIGNKSKADKYEDAMNYGHEIVKRNNVHLVGVVQSRRPPEKVKIANINDIEKLRPGIEELKNSGALEERARIVISNFRKKIYAERYLPDDPETLIMDDIMEVAILKQNMGKLGMIKYLFVPESCSFYKYEEEENENI